MDEQRETSEKLQIGANYPMFQMAKALVSAESHEDPAARTRAEGKVEKWLRVIKGILSGTFNVGSRKPIKEVPVWATPEVVTGGFVTGALLAGGPVQEHERQCLDQLPVAVPEADVRAVLNSYFLSDPGLAALQERLHNNCYDIGVPEEGALLVIAWLVANGHADMARDVLDAIGSHFANLRFYPIPTDAPIKCGDRVHVETVATVTKRLAAILPNNNVLTQKASIEKLLPMFDRAVALFLETVQGDQPRVRGREGQRFIVDGGWPCQTYPEGWASRGKAWLHEFAELRGSNLDSKMPIRSKSRLAEIQAFLERCVANPRALTGRDVGKIRLIIAGFVAKRGEPGSRQCNEKRARQHADVARPMFFDVATAVTPRLHALAQDDGIVDMDRVSQPISSAEAGISKLPAGTRIPETIQRKLERCRSDSMEALVERRIITSGETLARVLPQTTSSIKAAALADAGLRYLYAATYRAFRRRRSLLLLNLQSQVKIEELPWIAAIEPLRQNDASTKEAGLRCLSAVSALTLRAFPQAIVPNKLLQELRALAKEAGIQMPFVDELAADIFMGQFAPNFVAAAKTAAQLLDGSLYERYYGINWSEVRNLPEPSAEPVTKTASRSPADQLLRICEARAGISFGGYRPAENGMIIEQQQILTTQNLAVLFAGLSLQNAPNVHLMRMAQNRFGWICRRQQTKTTKWHARLIMIKNTAYAWRQMIFFLSMLPTQEAREFLPFAEEHLGKQNADFQQRFAPVVRGLEFAFNNVLHDDEEMRVNGARRFLGWSKDKHWLLAIQ